MRSFRSLCAPCVSVSLLVCAVLPTIPAASFVEDEPIRVLFLSKSSGFQHSAITRQDEAPSHVERILEALAKSHDLELTASKDASLISAEGLAAFDVVIFYTTGDLTQAGGGSKGIFAGDGNPPMPADGVKQLEYWIRKGGGFIGFHAASDTFRGGEGTPTPYVRMLGGEFLWHGAQFAGTVRVVDPEHPTMAGVPSPWTIKDEWYQFANFAQDDLHILAVLDSGEERKKQARYDIDPYPIIWCRALGEGRVFYNAMGHREDVWDHPDFQAAALRAIEWAAGRGETRAEPNAAEVLSGSD